MVIVNNVRCGLEASGGEDPEISGREQTDGERRLRKLVKAERRKKGLVMLLARCVRPGLL